MSIDIGLYERLGHIKTQHHPELPLTVCKYTRQFQARNLWDNVMLTMRGSVYDDDGNCVSQPLHKFFNYGEKPAPVGTYTVQEKLDGTCIVVFRWQGIPVVHTLGSFTSPQARDARTHIEKTYGWDWLAEGGTYVFEWMDPDNFTTLKYSGPKRIVLIAWLIDGHEIALTPRHWQGPVVRALPSGEIDALQASVPEDEEGYVLVYDDWRRGQRQRMKIKGARYLALSRAKWGLSERVVWEYVFERGEEERVVFLANLDEEARQWFGGIAEQMIASVQAMRDTGDRLFSNASQDDPGKRTLATRIQAMDPVYQPWCFARMNGKSLPLAYFAKQIRPKGGTVFASQDAA